jgi:hypothetical protein
MQTQDNDMTPPWMKKNPALSFWLSGADAAAGAVRGHAVAQAQRQMAVLMAEGMRLAFAPWSPLPAPRRRGRKVR